MYAGHDPFIELPVDPAVMFRVIQGLRPVRVTNDANHGSLSMSDSTWALVERCWAQQPNDRPTMDAVVATLKSDHDVNRRDIK